MQEFSFDFSGKEKKQVFWIEKKKKRANFKLLGDRLKSGKCYLSLQQSFLWDWHRSCWGEPGTSFWWFSHPWQRISWNCTRFSRKDIKLFLPLTVTMNRCLLSEEIRRALPPSLNWWVVKHSLSCKKLDKSVYIFSVVVLLWFIKTSESEYQALHFYSLSDWSSPPSPKNIPSGGYISFSVKNPVVKSLMSRWTRNPAGRFSLHGSILNMETERNVWFSLLFSQLCSYAPPVVSFLISEGSWRIQIYDKRRHTCGAHMFAPLTRLHLLMDRWGLLKRSNKPWCSEWCVRIMKTCFCCLLSASRPTSLTGTLSTTSMRTTLETFGNFQSMTVFKVLLGRLLCIHTGARTCLQWACRDSCCV